MPEYPDELIDALIDEAMTDAYNEDEQATAFFTLLEENLSLPFQAEVLGAKVTVQSLDLTSRPDIVAVCVQGEHRQKIPLRDLRIPDPPPEGAEWIAAWRQWSGWMEE